MRSAVRSEQAIGGLGFLLHSVVVLLYFLLDSFDAADALVIIARFRADWCSSFRSIVMTIEVVFRVWLVRLTINLRHAFEVKGAALPLVRRNGAVLIYLVMDNLKGRLVLVAINFNVLLLELHLNTMAARHRSERPSVVLCSQLPIYVEALVAV